MHFFEIPSLMDVVHSRAERLSNCMASGLHGPMFTYSAAEWRAKASSLHAEQAVKRKARQPQMSY